MTRRRLIGLRWCLGAMLWLFVGALQTSLGAAPADYYVDNRSANSSDENLGTRERPWKTIQHAADTVKPGDTVHVMPGVYPESVELKAPPETEKPGVPPRRPSPPRSLPPRITLVADGDGPAVIDGAAHVGPKDFEPTDTPGVFAWKPDQPFAFYGAGAPPQYVCWLFVGPTRMILKSPYELTVHDITDWRRLGAELAAGGARPEPSIAGKIWELSGEDLQKRIERAASGAELELADQHALVRAINGMFKPARLCETSLCRTVRLSEDAESLAAQAKRTADEDRRLGRALLAAAFPKTVAPAAGPLSPTDRMRFVRSKERVYVNFNGRDVPGGLQIEVAYRPYGIRVSGLRNVHVKGFVFRRQVLQAICLDRSSSDCLVEDCDVLQPNMHGIMTGGENCVVRRVRVFDATMWASNFFGLNHKIQECVFQQCGYRLDSAGEPWVGVLKSNGGSFHTVRHNLIFDRPRSRWQVGDEWVIRGTHDFPFGGIWFDCDNKDNRVYGNCIAGSPHAGLYVEYGLSRHLYAFNTIQDCAMGITFRQSWQNVVRNNWVFDSEAVGAGSVDTEMFCGQAHPGLDDPNWGREMLDGICLWHTFVDPPTSENIAVENLVQVSGRAVSIPVPATLNERAIQDAARIMCLKDPAALQQQLPAGLDYRRAARASYKSPLNNLLDCNLYVRPKNGWHHGFGFFLDKRIESLEDFREQTALERHGKVGAFTPADIGLTICWTIPPERRLADRPVAFDYDGGAERPAPRIGAAANFWVDQEAEPYSWFQTSGNLQDAPLGTSSRRGIRQWTQWPACRSGLRALAVTGGAKPEDIPLEGAGWRTISIAVKPGTQMKVALCLKAAEVQPKNPGEGIEAFVHFSDWTGHHVRRDWLVGNRERPQLAQGTYDWTRMEKTVTVPESVTRMTVYAGLRPASGTLLLDDLEMNLFQPKPPLPGSKAD